MTHKSLAALCLTILFLGVPLLWHKRSWQPPPFTGDPCEIGAIKIEGDKVWVCVEVNMFKVVRGIK